MAIKLTEPRPASTLTRMEVRLTPETESRLNELAAETGRPAHDVVEDAVTAYLQEVARVRKTLNSRYDDIKTGRVKPIEGEEAYARFRRKSEERRAKL